MRPFIHPRLPLRILALPVLLCWLSASPSARSEINTDFQITEISPQIIQTPTFNYSSAPLRTVRSKNWLSIDVTFTWQPSQANQNFADDVTVDYYVLLANRNAERPQGTMLTGEVTHMNVPARKRSLHSVMFATPRTLERFFDGQPPSSGNSAVFDVGITVSWRGKVVAQKSLRGSGAWWPQYPSVAGYLLNKNQTPFAPLYWEYYEDLKRP